ncbi:anti-sigma factor [Lysinibacillus sp. 2017]|uniref:DUF3298 domain-containing protein n=1 Tax=unclassified Lysinibacillus TaxID=2636778 RepID=UPI000D525B4A|nr:MULTISPECIES: DUF3298 domain-containing protein [unclassified Lysinibacillus]AWE07723.1 anti-sigma factor [Lysinibacillus sp. 2017]TGN30760.1 anti-sigma-V factor rsiV [Lysinibacillus sp. S2017]
MDDKLKKLQDQYKDVPIPDELEMMIEKNLQRPQKKKRKLPIFLTSAAAAAVLFTVGLNTSPAMAKNLADVPVIGPIVQVLTFTNYEMVEDEYTADIKVPQISGSSADINALNEKYAEEGKALYEQFKVDIEEMEAGNMSVNSGYIIETDTDDILSFGRYVEVIVVSRSTVMKYTTIDKKAETVITLPSLFKDDRYVEIISRYVEDELRNRMIEANGDEMYWIGGTEWHDESFGVFESISPEQNFYITEAGKLVMSFDVYEIAPGFMGLVTVEIPTELLQDVLMSNKYIK